MEKRKNSKIPKSLSIEELSIEESKAKL